MQFEIETMEPGQPLRWGILGCGKISRDFAVAVQNHVEGTIYACCSSNIALKLLVCAMRAERCPNCLCVLSDSSVC